MYLYNSLILTRRRDSMELGSFMEFHTREGLGQADAFQESFAHVDAVERLGLDAVWMAESHFSPTRSVLSAPLVVAAAIAARTERIKIGTAVHVLPLGNPLRIAEEVATLDHICQGRFEFGVGRSGLPGSYEGYNIPYSESRERFIECLEIIRHAWTNDRFSYAGKFFCFEEVCLTPKPLQLPHPPIRIAANSLDTFRTAAVMGMPIFIGLRGQGLAQVAEQVAVYLNAWEMTGHEKPPDISLRVPVYVSETRSDALSDPEESFMRQFRRLGGQLAGSAVKPGTEDTEDRAARAAELTSLTWEEVRREKVAVGTPEMVVERIHELREQLGISGIAAEFNAGELIPADAVSSSVRLFCEKVAPDFK